MNVVKQDRLLGQLARDFEHHVLDTVGGEWNEKTLLENGTYWYEYSISKLHHALRKHKMTDEEEGRYKEFLTRLFPGMPPVNASANLLVEVKKMKTLNTELHYTIS